MPVSSQHFFTVRGRGFTDVQWANVTTAAARVLERAKAGGVKLSLESDATHLLLSSEGDEGGPLVIWKTGEPNIPKEVTTSGQFDAVVTTLFAIMKKIAPSIFEVTCPDGRDYRQLLARDDRGEWSKAKDLGSAAETKEHAFLVFVSKKKWHNPESGNTVEFISLPKKEQTKIRRQWELEYGRHLDDAKAKAKKELAEAQEAAGDLEKAQSRAQKPSRNASKGQMTNFDRTLYRAAIRVASKTRDPELKRQLLSVLRTAACDGTMACGDSMGCDGDMMARHEEGKDVDVGAWLRQNGHEDAASKWEQHEGEVRSKAASVFPSVFRLAWVHVKDFTRAHPGSKTASSSTSRRVAAAGKIAEKWIQDALKNPGRVRKYLGLPEGETIPMGRLNTAIEKVEKTGNKPLLAALLLTKHLKGKD